MFVRVGIMTTKSDSLFTDDTSQITESDSECFFWNRTTSNYFWPFENQTHAHVFEVTPVQTQIRGCVNCVTMKRRKIKTTEKNRVCKLKVKISRYYWWNFKVTEVVQSSSISKEPFRIWFSDLRCIISV